MSSNTFSQLAKVFADEKNIKIIKATNIKKGCNIKGISEKTGIVTSQLYYPVKKLVELDLLEVVRTEQIKNLQEYYYSSYKLNDHSEISADYNNSQLDGISMSSQWVASHKEEFVKMFLYRMQMFLDTATNEMTKFQEDPNYLIRSGGIFSTPKLSYGAQKKLFSDMYELVSQAEANDTGKNKEEFNFMIEKW
ncbi:winged helix-turn-helix domain-containing protein [Liquorilactobacillus cacaonum]|uniref:Uncharacterized protein n=1 Tax=Liquorilactobacillus cacaonum DSM 21116 TaxID=1423729 RepID=A0A0R2CQT2_9LACO|nr:helix-turn-helix domain-containing protein [Liquorilactobacillus cacaonum]KRM90667.1 hypothetical protein FC80_GL000657 [Liquorilactobacillus cacaonum DSM 21116]